jgi:hypothetical protein
MKGILASVQQRAAGTLDASQIDRIATARIGA